MNDENAANPNETIAIEVIDLFKSYQKNIPVLNGLSLSVHKKEIFGFLGANGAGKSTTIEILEGYLPFDQGTVKVLGLDPIRDERALRPRVGLILQETSLPAYLKVVELFQFFTCLYPDPYTVDELLSMFQLEPQAYTQFQRLSGGQRRKLDMAIAILGKPELVFLDEPTTGFDPHARKEAWKIIQQVRDAGSTVFLTTQHMEEADALCNRIAIIAKGTIAAQGTPNQLKNQLKGSVLIRFVKIPGQLLERFSTLPCVTKMDVEGEMIVLRTSDSEKTMRALYREATEQSFSLQNLTIQQPTLEEVFFSISKDANNGLPI